MTGMNFHLIIIAILKHFYMFRQPIGAVRPHSSPFTSKLRIWGSKVSKSHWHSWLWRTVWEKGKFSIHSFRQNFWVYACYIRYIRGLGTTTREQLMYSSWKVKLEVVQKEELTESLTITMTADMILFLFPLSNGLRPKSYTMRRHRNEVGIWAPFSHLQLTLSVRQTLPLRHLTSWCQWIQLLQPSFLHH